MARGEAPGPVGAPAGPHTGGSDSVKLAGSERGPRRRRGGGRMGFGRRRAVPVADAPVADSVEQALARDRAAMLYSYGRAGVAITVVASCGLVAMLAPYGSARGMSLWLAGMIGVQLVRAGDLWLSHRERGRDFDGLARIRRFSVGTAASALFWGAFPLLFFAHVPAAGRMAVAVTVAAMSGSSTTVLAPCLPLARFYCTTLLVPAAAMLIALGGREESLLGVLGLADCVVLLVSARTAHLSGVGALRLSRENERLVARAETQQRETEAAYRELSVAQTALAESHHWLETRVAERTAELAQEVRARERYADALARLASTDPLTGLMNRTTFTSRLARMLAEAERAALQVAVLFLDLDNFKQINDVRGHETGDRVLQAAARVLSAQLPPSAEVARWGGDEFLIAVNEGSGEGAGEIARRLRAALAEPLEIGADSMRMEATIGVALFPKDARTQDELIRAADVAMYEAKREGKGRAKLFDPALARAMAERYALEQGLRQAMAREELSLAFQPIVAARDGRCSAFEALLRWRHPRRGMISPVHFIPIAEQTGQIEEISRWVLQEACREAAGWPDPAVAVTVNISVAHVLAGALIADVEAALARSGLAASRLQLEITESMFLGDHVRAAPVFEALRARGIRILLDDFGTGYSSLAYLGQLPIDVIKIDRSFVVSASRDGYATIEAILSIARALGMEVTAEGVATAEQRDRLRSLGVQRFQGYFFSEPMPAVEVAAWLDRTGSPAVAAA